MNIDRPLIKSNSTQFIHKPKPSPLKRSRPCTCKTWPATNGRKALDSYFGIDKKPKLIAANVDAPKYELPGELPNPPSDTKSPSPTQVPFPTRGGQSIQAFPIQDDQEAAREESPDLDPPNQHQQILNAFSSLLNNLHSKAITPQQCLITLNIPNSDPKASIRQFIQAMQSMYEAAIIHDTLQQLFPSSEIASKTLNNQKVKFEEKCVELQNSKLLLEKECEALKSRAKQDGEAKQELKLECEALKSQVDSLKADTHKLQQECASLKADTEGFEGLKTQLEALKSNADSAQELEEECERLKDQLHSLLENTHHQEELKSVSEKLSLHVPVQENVVEMVDSMIQKYNAITQDMYTSMTEATSQSVTLKRLHDRVSKLDAEKHEWEMEKADLRGKHEQESSRIKTFEQEISNLRSTHLVTQSSHEKLQETHRQKLEEVSRLRDALKSSNHEKAVVQTRLDEMETKMAHLTYTHSTTLSTLETVQLRVKTLEGDLIHKLRQAEQVAKSQLSAKNAELQSVEGVIQSLRHDLMNAENQVKKLEKKKDEVEKREMSGQNQLEALLTEQMSWKKARHEHKEKELAMKNQIEALLAEKSALEVAKETMTANARTISDLQFAKTNAEKQNQTLQASVTQFKLQLEQIQGEKRVLELQKEEKRVHPKPELIEQMTEHEKDAARLAAMVQPKICVAFSGFKDALPNYTTSDKARLQTMISNLPNGEVSKSLTNEIDVAVTHVIGPPDGKTLKTYAAYLMNRWIVTDYKWVEDSSKAGRWLDPQAYGLKNDVASPFKDKFCAITLGFEKECAAEASKGIRVAYARQLLNHGGATMVDLNGPGKVDFIVCAVAEQKALKGRGGVLLDWSAFTKLVMPSQ
jgi:hypothetical protein